MRSLCIVYVISYFLTSSVADECAKEQEIIKQVFVNGQGDIQPDGENGPLIVDIGFEINVLSVVPHTSSLHIDGVLTRTWKDPSLYFSHLRPCKAYVNMLGHRGNLWIPELSFTNVDDLVLHKHSVTIQLNQDGTMVHSQRLKQHIPCKTNILDYPFGNTTCTMVWRNEANSRDRQQIKWDQNTLRSALEENNVKEVGDLILLDMDFIHSELFRQNGVFDELTVVFHFRRGHHKVLFLFFVPSVLFMIVSWLSLSLGPMAITRSILIIGSLILLLIHYYTNMVGLPETTGVTSIDIWKIFSLLFVVSILFELVIVSCMASVGRSRKWTSCCHRKRAKGKYELEPLYEELNDLRARKTRRTCNCCRYSALFLDFASLWVTAAVFILFSIFFYVKGAILVKLLNDINLNNLNIFT